jgi:hypothetical protein
MVLHRTRCAIRRFAAGSEINSRREYDRWAKDHPNDAKKMGGFVFFAHLEKEGQTFSISVPPAANGKSFTSGFVTEVD